MKDKKRTKFEIIIIEDGKEKCRLKPTTFIGFGFGKQPNGDVRTNFLVFGKESDVLFALHKLLEGMIEKIGSLKIMMVLQGAVNENLENQKSDQKLKKHADDSAKGKNTIN